jgi:TM2 domain-containing membrane protein YozV
MTAITRPTKFCYACGAVIDAAAVACPTCGTPQPSTTALAVRSEKRILPAALLCFFLGVFGAHRFYVGKVGTGILQLCTLGGFGIWWLVDMIMIVVGSFKDADGEKITAWT